MIRYVRALPLVILFSLLSTALSVPYRTQRAAPIQTKSDKGLETKLEQRIPELMSAADIPGLSIALIRNGELTWSRGFGIINADTKKLVDDNTIFEAASLSKPVFAYAVLKLVDSGKLSLDTPLVQYLPGRYDVGDDPRLDQITARRVLSHTTGFPNWRPRGDKTLKIFFTPGDRFSYSGEGFVYLSRVVEHLTGEKLESFMKSTVLDPLGMTSSSYIWREDYETRKAFSHNSVGAVSGRFKPDTANAAASLQTTAADYGRFVAAILKGTGLKAETAKLMLTPQISVGEAPNSINVKETKLSTSVAWGLGWGLEKTSDGIAFWHWGDNGDTKAFVIAFEKQKTGVVMFANSANGLSIIREVLDQTLGGEHPALSWIKYEHYNSTSRLMFKAILKSDAETVLADYRNRRKPSQPSSGITGNSNGSETNSTSPNYVVALTETQMNQLGYQLLSVKRVKDAIAVFKQNTVDFPDAFNTWDSLAEAYMISGDKDAAIKYYQKSIELNPNNTNGVQKLKELRSATAENP